MLLPHPDDKRKYVRTYHAKTNGGETISIIDFTDDEDTDLKNLGNKDYWDDVLERTSRNSQFNQPVFIIMIAQNRLKYYGGGLDIWDYFEEFNPSLCKPHYLSLPESKN